MSYKNQLMAYHKLRFFPSNDMDPVFSLLEIIKQLKENFNRVFMQLTYTTWKVELPCKLVDLKHWLINLLPHLSEPRLQQFLDQFQSKVINVTPMHTAWQTLQDSWFLKMTALNHRTWWDQCWPPKKAPHQGKVAKRNRQKKVTRGESLDFPNPTGGWLFWTPLEMSKMIEHVWNFTPRKCLTMQPGFSHLTQWFIATSPSTWNTACILRHQTW